jgi:hypothetical protein
VRRILWLQLTSRNKILPLLKVEVKIESPPLRNHMGMFSFMATRVEGFMMGNSHGWGTRPIILGICPGILPCRFQCCPGPEF